jgi:hypothetical protein
MRTRPIASAQDFGYDIGRGMNQAGQQLENLGNVVGQIGEKLAVQRREAEDAVGISSYTTSYGPAAQQMAQDLQQQYPDGGKDYTDALQNGLTTLHQQTIDNLRQQGINLSPQAQNRLALHNADLQLHYLTQATTDAHNAQIVKLQSQQEQNVAKINSGVLNGQIPVEDAHKQIDDVVANSRQLYRPEQLKKLEEQWKQDAVDSRIKGLLKGAEFADAQGDTATGDTLRGQAEQVSDQYYGKSGSAQAAPTAPYVQRVIAIESGGNPNAVAGSHKGLGQFSPALEAKYGINDSNRTDPQVQAAAIQQEADENRPQLAKALGRDPTPGELYLAHQQGLAGATAILTHPDMPAWQAIRPFYKDDATAKQAIAGNGGSDQISAGDFAAQWKAKFERQQFAGGSITDAPTGPPSNTGPAPIMPNGDKALYWDKQFTASMADGNRAITLRDKRAKEASSAEWDRVFKDIYSDDPKETIQSVANNSTLLRSDRENLVGIMERQAKPDPVSRLSQATAATLLDRMALPEGDPRKITDPAPIVKAFTSQQLSETHFKFLMDQLHNGVGADTPLSKLQANFVKGVKDQLDLAALSGEGSPFTSYEFQRFVAGRVQDYQKAGKDPAVLFDPSSSEYLGRRDKTGKVPILEQFLHPAQKQVQEEAAATPPARSPQDLAAEVQRLDSWFRARGVGQPMPEVPQSQ